MDCYEVNSGVTTLVRDLSEYADYTITVDSAITYDVIYCGPMALYYLNARGGWDSFLIEGKVKRTDNMSQSDYGRKYDNTTAQFGKTRYMNEITESYELHTGWLTDDQAARLAKHLLPSNRVYAHNLETDRIFPVVITDSNAEYKTFKNEKRLVSYQINISSSQTMVRR